jgi:hypothetical protein
MDNNVFDPESGQWPTGSSQHYCMPSADTLPSFDTAFIVDLFIHRNWARSSSSGQSMNCITTTPGKPHQNSRPTVRSRNV